MATMLFVAAWTYLRAVLFVRGSPPFYLYLARVSLPLLGTCFTQTPGVSGARSIVRAALFLTSFYLGFIRKWKRHSIMTYDEDNEKIREVVTTWMRATGRGPLGNSFKSHSGGRGFPLAGSAAMRGREAFAGALRSALGQVRIEGKPDVQEIHVAGDYAFCQNQLSLTVTPLQGGPARRRAGPTLSVFRK
jgi:hypothetical protein